MELMETGLEEMGRGGCGSGEHGGRDLTASGHGDRGEVIVIEQIGYACEINMTWATSYNIMQPHTNMHHTHHVKHASTSCA